MLIWKVLKTKQIHPPTINEWLLIEERMREREQLTVWCTRWILHLRDIQGPSLGRLPFRGPSTCHPDSSSPGKWWWAAEARGQSHTSCPQTKPLWQNSRPIQELAQQLEKILDSHEYLKKKKTHYTIVGWETQTRSIAQKNKNKSFLKYFCQLTHSPRLELFYFAGGLERPIDGHHFHLIERAQLQSLHQDGVLVLLGRGALPSALSCKQCRSINIKSRLLTNLNHFSLYTFTLKHSILKLLNFFNIGLEGILEPSVS